MPNKLTTTFADLYRSKLKKNESIVNLKQSNDKYVEKNY